MPLGIIDNYAGLGRHVRCQNWRDQPRNKIHVALSLSRQKFGIDRFNFKHARNTCAIRCEDCASCNAVAGKHELMAVSLSRKLQQHIRNMFSRGHQETMRDLCGDVKHVAGSEPLEQR